MKKNVRLVLLLAMIAVMIVMTAVFASAADVATADEFKAAVAAGGEVNLTGNITLSEGITIDRNVTIKGNGYTIEFTAGTKLETPVSTHAGNAARQIESYAIKFVGGTAILQNVTVKAPADGTADVGARTGIFFIDGAFADVTLTDTKTDGGYITVMFNAAGKLTVNGTEETTVLGANGGYQYVMGSSVASQNTETGAVPEIIINGGTISNEATATAGDMMRFDSGVKLTVNGGKLNARGDAIYTAGGAKFGVFTFNGGTIVATGTPVNPSGEYDLIVKGGSFTSGTGGTVLNFRSTRAGSTLVVENAKLTGNTSGGCVLVAAIPNDGNLTVKNCEFIGYRGVRLKVTTNVTVENCSFQCFGTQVSGQILYADVNNSGSHVIKGCNIDAATGHTGTAIKANGFAYGTTGATYTYIDNVVVAGNVAFNTNYANTYNIVSGTYTVTGTNYLCYLSDGGAVVNVSGGTFVNNGTNDMFHKRNGALTITGGTFTQNSDKPILNFYHGSLAVVSGAVSIENVELTNAGSGAAILFSVGGHLTLKDATVSAGAAALDLSALPADLAMAVSVVDSKLSTTGAGEAMLDPNGYVTVSDTSLPYFNIGGENISWADALAGVAAGGTITVAGPVDWVLEIETDKTFTLNAGEYVLPALNIVSGNVTLANVKLSTVSSAAALTIGEGATVAIGEGCEFTASASGAAIHNYGTLVIDGATVTTTGSGYSINNAGNLTIESGNFNGTIYVGGTAVINNGTFRASGTYTHHSTRSPLVFMNGRGHLTINGGDFKKTNAEDGEDNSGNVAPDCVIGTNDGYSTIIITGGTFEAEGDYGYVLNLRSNDFVSITGGTFISGNTAYAVVRIGGMTGNSCADNKSTVLSGFTTEGGCTGLELVSGGKFSFEISDVTLSGSKYVIHLQNGSKNATVTIKNGTYTSEGEAVIQASGANLVIEGGSFIAKNAAVVLNLSDNDVVSNVTVKGGTFRSEGTGAVISIAQNNFNAKDYPEASSVAEDYTGATCQMGDLVIEGGTFTAMNARVINHISIKTAASVDVTIKGGTFTGGSDAVVYIAASNPDTKIVIGGKLTLVGSAADAAVVKLGAETLKYKKNGENKTYKYAAGCQVVVDGAVVICRNATATALIDNSAAESTATVELASATLLSSVNTGYFYNAAEGAMPIDANALSVKYGTANFYAWVGATADDNAPATSTGASVRAEVDSQGIRFSATIDAESVAALKALGTEVTYGVVIAPMDFVVNAGSFTIEALQALAEDKGFGETPAKVYANIQAVNSLKVAEDGSVSFNGVIVNVKAANYGRDFAAIAYACVDGTYYYSAFDAEDNVRNMAEVAAAALADVKDAADVEAGYIHEVNGKYSKYTAEQCEALAKYCA